jgi:hypothetical protein
MRRNERLAQNLAALDPSGDYRDHVRPLCILPPCRSHRADLQRGEPAAEPRALMERRADAERAGGSKAPRDSRTSPRSAEMGLLPYWTKEPAKAQRPINARGETAARSGMFRGALAQRRCVVHAEFADCSGNRLSRQRGAASARPHLGGGTSAAGVHFLWALAGARGELSRKTLRRSCGHP